MESVSDYMELQSRVQILQAQITQMESSKDIYEASTKHLLTFLDAFTSRLSTPGNTPSTGKDSTRHRRRSAGAGTFTRDRVICEDSQKTSSTFHNLA